MLEVVNEEDDGREKDADCHGRRGRYGAERRVWEMEPPGTGAETGADGILPDGRPSEEDEKGGTDED